MSTRDEIIGKIRGGLGRNGPLDQDTVQTLEEELRNPSRNLIPARADVEQRERVTLFVDMAEEASATVERIDDLAEAPKALSRYLAQHNLGTRVVMAPDPGLDEIPWHTAPLLTIDRGVAEPSDEVSVTPAFTGVAETGTLMLISGSHHPSTLNLLPDTHVVVLRESQIVGSYEDGWDLLRRARAADAETLPRTVLFVTGPSRSADIEQTLQMGAHGPRRVHVLLIADHG